MEGLYAYSDESGNTGLSLFDAQQPWFWTVTLIAPKDLDPPATKAVARWCKALAVPDLHVVDTIIDNGINPAIPAHVYGNRLLRLGLAHAIVSNISPRSQEEWWRVFETGDIDGFPPGSQAGPRQRRTKSEGSESACLRAMRSTGLSSTPMSFRNSH